MKEAILSVQKQADMDLEIIVVDDGSTDDTGTIAEQMADRVIHLEHKGAASARNVGIRAARGEWILLLDADDSLAPDSLKMLYKTIAEEKNTEAVFAMARDFISPELTEEQRKTLLAKPDPYSGVLPGCSLIQKKVFERIGYFREDLNGGETVEWMMRMRSAVVKTMQIDAVTLYRRLHLTNTGRMHRQTEWQNYAAVLRERRKSMRRQDHENGDSDIS